jgi:lipid-A-disaccharide synthase-like uncharacterized protein
MSDFARRHHDEPRRDESLRSPAPPSGPSGEIAGRAEAQRRADRIAAFRRELDALMSDGVGAITPAQHADIVRYHDHVLRRLAAVHDIDRTAAAHRLSRGMQVAALVASVALTAAVYSLVARFWGRFDLPLQATLLCAFPLAALAGVELSAQRERTLYVASIFGLVAFATYWLAVFVLSGLLNVPVTPPALWGGALFGAALALAYGFRVVFAGALVALLVALAGTVFQAAGMPWTLVPAFPEIVGASAFLLTLLSGRFGMAQPSFAAVTRGVGFTVGFAALLFLSAAAPASLLPSPSHVTEGFYQGVMLLACLVVLVFALRRSWGESIVIAAGALTLFLGVRYVDWFWDALPRYAFFLMLAAAAVAWLYALRRLRARL